MDRFFATPAPLIGQYVLTGEELHHLHVKRVRPGDRICLFDGCGYEYYGRLCSINKKKAVLAIEQRCWVDRELPVVITLGQALPKNQAWDWILQKGTELGVRCFVPIISDYVATANWQGKISRWRKTIIAACKQCGRNLLPVISTPVPWSQLWPEQPSADMTLLAHPAAPQTLAQVLRQLEPAKIRQIRVLVGPEGGWSPREVTQAQEHGCHCFSLGPRILRAETAALSIVANLALHFSVSQA